VVDKAPDAFRTISEVADDLDLPQHVLRFWETRFQQIKPMKRGGGRRYYRPDDIDLLRGIRYLLYGEGYTIRGAQRILKDHGVRFVQQVWRAGAPQPSRGSEAEPEIAEAAPARPAPASARRPDPDSAHRRLFGLLPSFLSSGIDEERLAQSRALDEGKDITPSPAIAIAEAAAEPEMHSAPVVPRDQPDLRAKLRETLRELLACRKLLDAALAEA
jgi:DNA-binding transcriptional MerR regulator